MGLEDSVAVLYGAGVIPQMPSRGITACEANADANMFAQMTPGVGAALGLSGNSFTPFGDGSWITQTGPNAWDQLSGVSSTLFGLWVSKPGQQLGNGVINDSFHDLSLGNRAYRRDWQQAARTMFSGATEAADIAGKALGILGVATAVYGASQDASSCACKGAK